MQRKASQKTIMLIKNEQDKMNRKLNSQSRYVPDIDANYYGYSNAIMKDVTELTNLSYKNAQSMLKDLKDFNSNKNLKLVNLSGTDVPIKNRQYAPKNKLDMVRDLQIKADKFSLTLQDALKKSKFEYIYKNESTGETERRERKMYNKFIQKSTSMQPTLYKFGNKLIGKRIKDFDYKTIKITSSNIDTIIKNLKSQVTGNVIKTKNLEGNFFKALANNTSRQFATSIKNILDKEGVDAIEFLYLFETTGAFDFEFIYDETSVDKIKQEIRSEIEALRKGKNEGYKSFRKKIKAYEKKI